jgi:hypothetical protein
MQYLNMESDNNLFFSSFSSSSTLFKSSSLLSMSSLIGNLYLIGLISGYFEVTIFSVSNGI